MDQLLAAACMVLSGKSGAIEEGTSGGALLALFLDSAASSSNFLAVADADRDSLVSRAMAGLVTESNGKKTGEAIKKWQAFRLEQRGASAGAHSRKSNYSTVAVCLPCVGLDNCERKTLVQTVRVMRLSVPSSTAYGLSGRSTFTWHGSDSHLGSIIHCFSFWLLALTVRRCPATGGNLCVWYSE